MIDSIAKGMLIGLLVGPPFGFVVIAALEASDRYRFRRACRAIKTGRVTLPAYAGALRFRIGWGERPMVGTTEDMEEERAWEQQSARLKPGSVLMDEAMLALGQVDLSLPFTPMMPLERFKAKARAYFERVKPVRSMFG